MLQEELKIRQALHDKAMTDQHLERCQLMRALRLDKGKRKDKAHQGEKEAIKPKEKAVWVTVGKGKETVSQFSVAPLENAVPSASNLPIMQQIVPEVLEDAHKVGDSDVLSPQELGAAQGPDVPPPLPTSQQGEDMPIKFFQDAQVGASIGKVFLEDPLPSVGGYSPLFIREEPRDI
ncbi:hypothetical protein U1Q18_035889 [Sarracenia purpurea var. burkii]